MEPWTYSALGLLLLAGCSENAVQPRTASHVAPTPARAPLADATSPSRGVVHVSDDVRKACGISDSEAHFAFDSKQLQSGEQPVLTKLATCFTTGPLAGSQMRLVGHADPRGGDDYNMVLGGSRADTVKAFLVMRGLPASRIATTSRGALDARGTNEQSWMEDRRVDVVAASQ